MSDAVVILSACRTPIGSFCGIFSTLSAHDLGKTVIAEALTRASIPPEDVSEVIMGQALMAGQGQNPARQAALKAGLPNHVPAYTINMLCGSGLKSVLAGYQAIRSGDSTIVVCGGQESMSQAPHTIMMRTSVKMGNGTLYDSMLSDGLTDAFNDVHMGLTAEEIVKLHNLTREEQDAFAYESQRKTKVAQECKLFAKEIVPVSVPGRKGPTLVIDDEYPKPETTIEILSKLRPAFNKNGSVTAGNSSGINDGAAAVVLTSQAEALKRGIKPIARIVAISQTGLDPMQMGLGPISAVKLVLKKANWNLNDVGLYELNEAFASQSIAVQRELGIPVDKINVNGGAIALGHPIGASGTRVLVTLLHALEQHNKSKGIASLCIGGGMGIAVAVERL